MTILVTGGAGYIGSFMTRRLLDDGHAVVVLDSLERGNKDVIDTRAKQEIGNLLDEKFLDNVFSSHSFDAVVHFAAYISMGESMENPGLYFSNNLFATGYLLQQMKEHDVKKIIFSSTAGVYGSPTKVPIPEDHSKNPENPYGESKYMTERMLSWYFTIHGIRSVCLRYFNAAGASEDGVYGETHIPETHIIPRVIECVLEDKAFTLFGDDYKTPDGTCIRDYIHVLDLVEAHLLALQKITKESIHTSYNVGTGKGYSNRQIVAMVEEVSGKKIPVEVQIRRPGDADSLIADQTKISRELGFRPKYSDLETIIKTAWKFHKSYLSP